MFHKITSVNIRWKPKSDSEWKEYLEQKAIALENPVEPKALKPISIAQRKSKAKRLRKAFEPSTPTPTISYSYQQFQSELESEVQREYQHYTMEESYD